jgi:hypothetical protein
MSHTTADGSRSAKCGVLYRIVAVLTVFSLVAIICLPLLAQVRGPAKKPPKGKTEAGAAKKKPVEEPVVEEEPAEPEPTYKKLDVDDSHKKSQSLVGQVLTQGNFGGDNSQQAFDDYFNKYFLPQWTLPKGSTELPKERSKLRSLLGKKTTGGSAVHDHLNELVLEFMKELVAGEYSPAVRINAMLMIGELNREEQPPAPLPDALTYLITAAEDTKLPTAIRAAALVGILRHAEAGVQDEDLRRTLTTNMIRLATAKLPAGPSASGYGWLRMQAIEVLAAMRSVGEGNAVFNAIFKNVSDDKLPYFVQSAAVEGLGQLNYSSTTGINAMETAAALGQFAERACDEELRLAKKASEEKQASRTPADDPMGAHGPKSFVSRQRMLQRLDAVLIALDGKKGTEAKGIASLARDANQQAAVGELKKTIETACVSLDVKDDAKDPKSIVVGLQKNIKSWLDKNVK